MIEIKQPRYHDRVVLLARWKLPCGTDAKVRILHGSYKGDYKVTNDVICKAPIEPLTTRTGQIVQMRAVKIDDMERIEDE